MEEGVGLISPPMRGSWRGSVGYIPLNIFATTFYLLKTPVCRQAGSLTLPDREGIEQKQNPALLEGRGALLERYFFSPKGLGTRAAC